MNIRHVILGVGMLALGAAGFAGCGGNPCQDYNDAFTKASSGKGCSFLKMVQIPQSEIDNCPDEFSTFSDCVTGCLGKLKDCTDAKQAGDFSTCYTGCAAKAQ